MTIHANDAMHSHLRKYLVAQGVAILPRALYANLRTGPVALYGDRAAAGVAGTVTTLDETGNAEPILVAATGASGYKGWLFGFAVDMSQQPTTTGVELNGVAQNMQIQISSAGVARNIPIGVASRIYGTNGTAGANPQQSACFSWFRFPNALPWDGTDSASYIKLLNTNTIATDADTGLTVYIDAWVSQAADQAQPDSPLLFPDDCGDGAASTWIDTLVGYAKLRGMIRG